ncbi:pyridoxal phosphate-dependent aminotransferase [Limosilactobacillus mucosae]|uniref:pyridoxal phosphate-dependent aminotransferase n=1 Tax=Limosilactobacillus mucosae TaxID=97478 RepID=UPI0025A478FC|nr:pyridoxal phosphate-dependent aminotransferase [Limosilactobacillus mucosae]MDM8219376.1 pyridoxal phosphate-dependent aminotransferase [Limosilactobacillus mucosae]MDM8313994.1 pyridoxal phosphate-dependent aminotransferase [Limosilactobacillus mucosae]
MEISERVSNIQPSATLALSGKAKAMKAQGIDVLNLSIGQPDFNTPKHIGQAAIKAIESGDVDFYTAAVGIEPLRKAIADKENADHGTNFTADNVVVMNGAKMTLYALGQALFNEGDEVLIPLPYWVTYGEQVKLAGAKPVFVKPAAGRLTVAPEELEAARTPKTKAMILNTPNNPSGAVYTREQLQSIGDWAVEHNVIVIADDIYGKLVYNGTKFVSLLDLSPEIRQQTILVNGMSKTYSMTGWRVGYAIADADVVKGLKTFLSHAAGNMAAVSQYAALAAITGDQSCVEEMRATYEERINTLYPLLNEIPGFKLDVKPAGAFYAFPDVSEAVKLTGFASTDEFVNALLEEAHVAVVPGAAFGMENHVRISYATSMDVLKEAVQRIQAFMANHQK